jgi:hypothetical protein
MKSTIINFAGIGNNATSVTSETSLFNTAPKYKTDVLQTDTGIENNERDEAFVTPMRVKPPTSGDETGKVTNENPREAAQSTTHNWYIPAVLGVAAVIFRVFVTYLYFVLIKRDKRPYKRIREV